MTANLITVFALVVGIVWLGVLFASAIRNRGGEEVAPNLKPGITDQEMETRRLEGGQKAAIAFSAFLAISLPLYFLGETGRQENFVNEFEEAAQERGALIVEEFRCFDCHGPEGVGGTARYVEKRSGVTVSWAVPSLNDVLFRYDEAELTFWITYGRGNTPMPAWGLAGGGPLNEAQVSDVVHYLSTIQVPQNEALAELEPGIEVQLDRLEAAEATVSTAIINQAQVVANIDAAPSRLVIVDPLATRAGDLLDGAAEGLDTDDDGLSDVAEEELSAISVEVLEALTVVDPIALDPETADAELAEQAVSSLEDSLEIAPVLEIYLDTIQLAIEEGTVDPAVGISEGAIAELEAIAITAADLGVTVPPAMRDLADAEDLVAALEEAAAAETPVEGAAALAAQAGASVTAGSDSDGDGLSAVAEEDITNQMTEANGSTIPGGLGAISLDPTNPASVGGEPDNVTAATMVGKLESLHTSLQVTSDNIDKLREQEVGGLEFLEAAQDTGAWEIDFEGVAEAMGTDVETARRAVGLFNSNCARCHTAGFSAGVPFTQEAGSGGFGPALWDGRPTVQFGEASENPADDLLVRFLTRGSEAQTPYGLNGFGSGRMPAFGAILSEADIELLAAYLRGGNMDGKG
ncbi:MAG TPA: c-type cytochrome [Acidimicrobiia bacterium]|nr:c-type cytochrome [Acidimicrobiia bacterium]